VSESAGLQRSVGSASLPVRLLLALVYVVAALILLGMGVYVSRGPLFLAALAVFAILPFGFVACVATAFVLAPWSRFGIWVDGFVPQLGRRPGLAAAAVLWTLGALLVWLARMT
jgi:hypothetical protein